MFKRATQATSSRARRTSTTSGPEIGLPLQQSFSSHSSDTQRQQQQQQQQYHHQGPTTSTVPSSSFDNNTNYSTTSTSTVSTQPTPSPSTTTNTTTSTPNPPPNFPTYPPPFNNPLHLDLPNSTLLPTETPYLHLVTPPLPFPPDFHTVFATLCDLLIDAYQRILSLVNSPAVCNLGSQQGLGDMFAKADARLRKVIVGGVVREFEVAAREAVKREAVGVQRVVLGGLMGG